MDSLLPAQNLHITHGIRNFSPFQCMRFVMNKFVTFETGSSTNSAADEQSAARPVFERIVTALRAGGAQVTCPIAEWDAYGWYIEVRYGAVRLTCMIQRSDEWLLLLSSSRSLRDRLTGRKHEAELNVFAADVVKAVEAAFDVRARLFQDELAFRAD